MGGCSEFCASDKTKRKGAEYAMDDLQVKEIMRWQASRVELSNNQMLQPTQKEHSMETSLQKF